MYTSDILFWTLMIAALMAVINCYWLAAKALFPGLVAGAGKRYQRPVRTTLVGVAAFVPFLILATAFFKTRHPVGQILGFTAVGVPIIAGLLGSAGLAQRIGLGLNSAVDEAQPWRAVLRGGIVFTFLMLLPFIGWFGILPWALFSGLGATVLGGLECRRESRKAREASLAAAMPAKSPETPADAPEGSPALASGN